MVIDAELGMKRFDEDALKSLPYLEQEADRRKNAPDGQLVPCPPAG